MAQTLFEKIWQDHVVTPLNSSTDLLFIDRHLVHEVTSPQAFSGLRDSNRVVRHPKRTIATMDHNVSTESRSWAAASPVAQKQLSALAKNCEEFGIELYDLSHELQGIVHVIGPEQGITLPGCTIVCGDSHTSTHGAFGALAFGIGTSEVEHVLATQTLPQKKAKTLRITVEGNVSQLVSAKDIALAIIGHVGTAGGTGYVIEYAGDAIRQLSMEGRMTLCNMSIEMGARAGIIAPDETTFAYLQNKPKAPKDKDWQSALAYWQTLYSDPDAKFDKEVRLDAANIKPMTTWGTSPEQVITVDQPIPDPDQEPNLIKADAMRQALNYMGLSAGQRPSDINVDVVFIGSCTNSRIEDLRAAAKVLKGQTINSNVQALIVPGSIPVKRQAEAEGLDKIFIEAGCQWREPGCSMCLAMNEDKLLPGQRCASTSNRNFEGRQGRNGRTHLMSPQLAAATAISGRIAMPATIKV